MSRKPIIVLLLPLLLACCCQQQQRVVEEQEEKVVKPPPPLHLGAVHQVYPEQNFALLRIIGPMPGPGDTLITHPADGSNSRIGNLVISTGQPTRNNIIAADIRSGTVVKGDRVFRYRNIAASASENQGALPNDALAEEVVAPMQVATPQPEEEEELPSNMRDDEFPSPVLDRPESEAEEEDDDSHDTHIEAHPEPSIPIQPSGAPSQAAPAYLNDIPDDISQWD